MLAWSALGPLPSKKIEDDRVQACGYQQAEKRANETAAKNRDAQRFTGPATLIEEYARAAEAAEQAKQEAKKCDEEARSRSDLAAQWANALIARDLRTWTIIEMLLLLGTIGVGVAALLQNSEAMRVQENRLEKEIEEGRLVGERQMRAYVLPIAVRHAWEEENNLILEIDFRNGGQTPAIKVAHHIALQGDRNPVGWEIKTRTAEGPIVSGETRTCRLVLNEEQTKELLASVLATDESLTVVWSYVYYTDVFGNRFRSAARFFTRTPPAEGSWDDWDMYYSDADPLFQGNHLTEEQKVRLDLTRHEMDEDS